MARLPQPGSDNGTWGDILNEYLLQALKPDGTLKDNSVTNAAIADNAVNAATIQDGSITEAQFDSAVQAKLNANAGVTEWADIANKPAVIAAGATSADAKTAIGLGNVDNTSDASKPISTAAQAALDGKAAVVHTHTAAQISDATTVGRSLLTAVDAPTARDTLGITSAIDAAVSQQLPYVPQLNKWRTAVARRAVRHPRILVVGDSASSARRSWQHQLAGRMYFPPSMADEQAGYMEVPFANGLYGTDMTRFNNIGYATDIDLLVATGTDEGAIQKGDYRYDEGSWRSPWTLGDHWSTGFPPNGMIDKFRIDDMNGASALTIRGSGHPDGTWWHGFNAKVSNTPLDIMSLAVNGVTAEWWKNQLTLDTTVLENWGAAVIKGLAEGFDPDLIIIALGANDLDNPAIINNVGSNLTDIIGVWRTLHPNADIALQTYWQPTWGVVRDQVLATATSQNVALLDFWPKIPPYDQYPGLYSDQYHLNDYGQRLIADMAVQQLGIPLS